MEACGETHGLLEANVAANGLGSVDCLRLAFSGESGSCRLYHNETHGNWGHSVVSEVGASYEEVPCVTLAGLFEMAGVSRCDLLKMNCEGAEFPIVMGMDRGLASRIGSFTLEFHAHLWDGHGMDDLFAKLGSLGFSCELRHFDGVNGWIVGWREGWA